VNVFFEANVGAVLQQNRVPREDLFVQSKFVSLPHHAPLIPPYPPYKGHHLNEAFRVSLYRSLENLRSTYIDAFLINAPEITVTPMLELLNIVQNAKKEGRVRYSGLCNVATVDILRHLHTTVPGSIQIVQNPLHSPWDPEYKILQYCRENGIQYNTFHTLTSSDRILQDEAIQLIAQNRHSTPQLLFLQFCVQSDMTPVVGPRRESNVLSDLPIANGNFQALSPDDMKAISRLFAEQIVINRYRSATLLVRRHRELRREQGRKKMRADQGKQMLRVIAAREEEEQQIVERAKARAKAFAEKLRADADAEITQEKVLEEEHQNRLRMLERKTSGELVKDEPVISNDKSNASRNVVPIVDDENDGLPTLNGKKGSLKQNDAES
jgi:diketogulonate reductase-like aldo/keto reductase